MSDAVNECSPLSLASPVMGSVESRRMHQMHLVKLGVNKGGRFWDPPGICVSGNPQPGNVRGNLESPKAFLESLVIRNLG